MAVKNPIRVLLEGYKGDLEIFAAKYEDYPARGVFSLKLPKEIYIDEKGLNRKTLPCKFQLENALWVVLEEKEEGKKILHGHIMENDETMLDDLNAAICWTTEEAMEEGVDIMDLYHLLIDPKSPTKSRSEWLDVFSYGLHQQSVFTYPTLPQALQETFKPIQRMSKQDSIRGDFVLMQKVGLTYVRWIEGTGKIVSCVLLRGLRTLGYEEMPVDFEALVYEAVHLSPLPSQVIDGEEEEEQENEQVKEDLSIEETQENDTTLDVNEDEELALQPQTIDGEEKTEDGKETEKEEDKGVTPSINDNEQQVNDATLAATEDDTLAKPASPAPSSPMPTTSSLHHEDADSAVKDTNPNIFTPIPITTPTSISPSEVKEADDENLTLAQRRELRRKREEEEKQKRLQAYFKDTVSPAVSNTIGGDGDASEERGKSNIKDRFELAKKQQQEQEEQRLARIKNDTARKLVYTTRQWNADGHLPPASTSTTDISVDGDKSTVSDGGKTVVENESSGPKSVRSAQSMRHLWEGVLNESKNSEESRYIAKKQSTISQFRLTDGTGFVKKRVGEWEELFIQISATSEQLNEFFAAAHTLSEHQHAQQKEDRWIAQERFRQECLVPEDFLINDTHIYSSLNLDHFLNSLLKKLLNESKTNQLPLPCGVYGESATKPPIDVFAAVVRTNDGKMYISLTVKATAGKELDLEVYGVRRVVVMANNQTLFEKFLNVIPEPWMLVSIPGYEPRSFSTPIQSEKSHPPPLEQLQEQEENVDETQADESVEQSEVKEDVEQQPATPERSVEKHYPEDEEDQQEEASALPVSSTHRRLTASRLQSSGPPSPSCSSALSVADEGEGTWVANPTPPRSRSPTNETTLDEQMEEEDPLDADLAREFGRRGSAPAAGGAPNSTNYLFQSDDEEDDDSYNVDEEEDGEGEDGDGEPNQFGRAMSLANVTTPRCFAPSPSGRDKKSPTSFSSSYAKSVHTMHKFSWTVDEETEFYLPLVRHANITIDNLPSILTTHACRNLFTLRCSGGSGGQSHLFTGTLKHALVDNSHYLVEGDKIFEWIRGAAASGWMVKYPMQSQRLGRTRKRFFVLRDSLLSYYPNKPQREEEILQANFSKHTLHLTEDTKVSIGRKFLLRCVVVVTPLDTLWIRMPRAFSSEATKWIYELNRAIQYQQRQKYFMTKPRIESKWYHESPHFTLRNVDCHVPSAEGNYVKVALFRLAVPVVANGSIKAIDPPVNCLYSVDIGSRDLPRCQLEIVNENESPMLPADLSVVKIYGGLVIFGGSHGFLGIGMISRTTGAAPSAHPPAPPTTATNMTSGGPVDRASILVLNGEQPGGMRKGSVAVTEETARKVMFCWPCDSPPAPTSSSSSSSSSAGPMQSPAGESGLDEGHEVPVYPHSQHSQNVITAITTGQRSAVFAAADSSGLVSLWHLPRSKYLQSLNPHNVLSNRSMQAVMKKLKPRWLATLDLRQLTPPPPAPAITSEKVTKLQFAFNDSYLLISTQKRLLLIILSTKDVVMAGPQRGMSISEIRGISFAEGPGATTGNGTESTTPIDVNNLSLGPSRVQTKREVLGFEAWVELDRALPHLQGIFDVFVDETTSAMPLPQRLSSLSASRDPDDRMATDRHRDSSINGDAWPHADKSLVEWRILENDEPSPSGYSNIFFTPGGSKKNDHPSAKKCTVSRIVWTEVMISAALERARPCP
eukprot:scaffold4731_cov175-Ochromonas_danica.AAC.18